MADQNQINPFGKLAKPAQRALANAGITTLAELAKWPESEFMKLHGIGKNAAQTLKIAMAAEQLSFKQ